MTEGMRRPPRLWEQKLEGLIRASGLGAGSVSGGTSPIVGAPAPGPGGPGESLEPPPVVDEDPTIPRVPATPSVFPAIGGLSILWTGLDDNGDPFPAGSRVEVHVSETTGFTPDSNTLRGVVNPGERLVVTDLASGTTYFVRFVLIFPDGTEGEASAQQSLSAGFVLSTNIGQGEITADLVNFDASAIGGIQQFVGTAQPTITNAGQANQTPADGSTWINTSNLSYYTLTSGAWVQRQWGQAAISAGAISTGQLAAGAITADSAIIANGAIGNAQIANAAITDAKIQNATITAAKIASINADSITTGTLTGRAISGGTITGATIQTRTSGLRVVITDSDTIQWWNGATFFADAKATGFTGTDGSVNGVGFFGATGSNAGVYVDGDLNTIRLKVDGAAVDMLGVYNNDTGASIDNVGITAAARLRRRSSRQALKYDMAPMRGELAAEVDDDRQLGVNTVDPMDVLNLAPTEFSIIDNGEATEQRVVGFIADDVAAKFPVACTRNAEGEPFGVFDTAILASLLAIVKDQQQTITDLTARIEALEG